VISVTDTEAVPYTSGGVCVSMWTEATKYFLSVDNVAVTSLEARPRVVPNKPAPVIESVALAQDSLVISWTAVSNQTYRLQFTEELGSTTWNDVLPDVLATGPTATTTNAVGNSPQRFYRVLLVQ
jgi:hypothetical protein